MPYGSDQAEEDFCDSRLRRLLNQLGAVRTVIVSDNPQVEHRAESDTHTSMSSITRMQVVWMPDIRGQ